MKTLFTTFFLPLGLILLGNLAMAVWAWRKSGTTYGVKRWWLGGLVSMFVVGYVVCTPWFGLALSHMLVDNVRARELDDPSKVDTIIVLTNGMFNAGPVGWLPRPDGIQRLAVAYELQRMINLRIPVIVSGGFTKGVKNPSEAAVTAAFFARQRTEVTPTELEEVSTDTYESAMQLAPILAKRGARNVLLVTSDIHMLRALATFRARGIDAIPAPVLNIPSELGIKMVLPSVYGLELTTSALYEVYGLIGYLVSGRISVADLTYSK